MSAYFYIRFFKEELKYIVKYTLLSESMKTKVMIRKTNEDDNMLPGAFLRLEKSGGDEVDTWTSGL